MSTPDPPGKRTNELAGLARLVEKCIARARELGYEKLTLWTNAILVSARKIYQAAGFTLMEENQHHSFGKDLIGQTWEINVRRK